MLLINPKKILIDKPESVVNSIKSYCHAEHSHLLDKAKVLLVQYDKHTVLVKGEVTPSRLAKLDFKVYDEKSVRKFKSTDKYVILQVDKI